MKELIRFLLMLVSVYMAISFLYTAIYEHNPTWLILSSIWIWMGIRFFPPFRQKPEDENNG